MSLPEINPPPEADNRPKRAGFTLLEAVLVFGMGAMVLVSLVGLILSSFRSVVTLRDRVIATQLGQEALEIAHNLRDKVFLEKLNPPSPSRDFDFYLQPCEGQTCCVDFQTNSRASTCPTKNQQQLYENSDGLYVISSAGNTPTRFYRWLIAAIEDPIPGGSTGEDKRLKVDVYVSWEDNEIKLTEYLYDWLPSIP